MRYYTQRSWIDVPDNQVPPTLYMALATVGHWARVLDRRRNSPETIAEAEAQRDHALRAAIALGCSDKQIQRAIAEYGRVDVAAFRELAAGDAILADLIVDAGLRREFIEGFTTVVVDEFGSVPDGEAALMALTPRFLQLLERYEEQAQASMAWRNALRWKLAQYRLDSQSSKGVPSGRHGPPISDLFLSSI